MDLDWEKVLYAVGGFLGGFFSQLLKLVAPSYSDLIAANKDLSDENAELREKIRGYEDTLRDQNEEWNIKDQ